MTYGTNGIGVSSCSIDRYGLVCVCEVGVGVARVGVAAVAAAARVEVVRVKAALLEIVRVETALLRTALRLLSLLIELLRDLVEDLGQRFFFVLDQVDVLTGQRVLERVDLALQLRLVALVELVALFREDLFALIDKMLYLGKNRGRNCYTVYEEEKHKDREIHKIAKNGIFTNMQRLKAEVEKEKGFENKMKNALSVLSEILQIHDLYYVTKDGSMRAVADKEFTGDASDIAEVTENDLFAESTLDLIKRHAPVFYNTLKTNGFETVLSVRVRKDDEICGYLVCAVKRSLRIWQENESAILYYLGELLSDEF